MTTAITVDDVRAHLERTLDLEDMGEVSRRDALPGWKRYMLKDTPSGLRLTGYDLRLMTTRSSTTVARCAGRVTGYWWRQTMGRRGWVSTPKDRFEPCPHPTIGCPARCGVHSCLRLDELGQGINLPVVARTRSWGHVIRTGDEWLGFDYWFGEAWRAQFCRIDRILIAEAFAAGVDDLRDVYRCRVDIVPSKRRDDHRGYLPLDAFLEVTERAHL